MGGGGRDRDIAAWNTEKKDGQVIKVIMIPTKTRVISATIDYRVLFWKVENF